MPTRRKDPKGRVLRDGESYRKNDVRYMYRYTSADGKRHSILNTPHRLHWMTGRLQGKN